MRTDAPSPRSAGPEQVVSAAAEARQQALLRPGMLLGKLLRGCGSASLQPLREGRRGIDRQALVTVPLRASCRELSNGVRYIAGCRRELRQDVVPLTVEQRCTAFLTPCRTLRRLSGQLPAVRTVLRRGLCSR